MVRVVAMADTHGHHATIDVPDGDVLVHAGDLTARGTLPQLRAVADWLAALPHRHKVVIAGNHDFALQRQPGPARALFTDAGLTYLEDEEVTLDGLRVYGSPWQPWFHDWAFNRRRGPDIDTCWRRIPTGLDLLVTHGPPAGFGDRCYDGRRVGCADLLARIVERRPRFHLFGHIHEDGGRWDDGVTTFVNVTTADDTRPCTVLDVSSAPG
ncbi:MAG: metallophosphoesterase [Kofleriaceae bacterium]|nr:metallophosphoesterase [Kofleriaceae bacterium]